MLTFQSKKKKLSVSIFGQLNITQNKVKRHTTKKEEKNTRQKCQIVANFMSIDRVRKTHDVKPHNGVSHLQSYIKSLLEVPLVLTLSLSEFQWYN